MRKKRKYGGIMRRVILSDSRSDFIKVIIAERKQSTYKPPTPSAPTLHKNLLIVGKKRAHFAQKCMGKDFDTCTLYNVNKES